MKEYSIKAEKGIVFFNIIGYTYLTILMVMCLFPFLFVVMGSLSTEADVIKYGFSLIPKSISFEAYKLLIEAPEQILIGYKNTIFITAVGTGAGLFLTAMSGYVLSRKRFKYRNAISFYLYFTTLFSGGMLSTYILIARYLQWKNTMLVLIIPGMLSVFYILIMKRFSSGVSDEIEESGRMDGASDFTIFTRLYLPLLGSSLASIGLFIALGYWNQWYNVMLYIDDQNLFTLQYQLHLMMSRIEFAAKMVAESGVPTVELPQQTLRMATVIVTIGPIVAAYPFIQKYFVKGVTIGSVKG